MGSRLKKPCLHSLEPHLKSKPSCKETLRGLTIPRASNGPQPLAECAAAFDQLAFVGHAVDGIHNDLRGWRFPELRPEVPALESQKQGPW